LDARFTPQQAINRSLPTPADCDLTVMLLWGRMGTPLAEKKADGTPYLSGTEWEFENAIRSNKPVFVYRRSEKLLLDPEDPKFDDKLTQKRRVDSFFSALVDEHGAIRHSFATYASTDDLLNRLRNDVEQLVKALIDDAQVETDGSGAQPVDVSGQKKLADVESNAPVASEVKRSLKVRVHRAYFGGRPEECYFINLTNLSSSRTLEVTHLWYEDEEHHIPINQTARKLPARLELDQSWESWIAVATLPLAHRETAFEMFRARTSDGSIFKSEKNDNVPPLGFVPGGPINRV
jgi:hypothetical protein